MGLGGCLRMGVGEGYGFKSINARRRVGNIWERLEQQSWIILPPYCWDYVMTQHAILPVCRMIYAKYPTRCRYDQAFSALCDGEPLKIIFQTIPDRLEVEWNATSVVQSLPGFAGDISSYHHPSAQTRQ